MIRLIVFVLCFLPIAPAVAEQASYGNVTLTGLARDVDWPYNQLGASYAMVCNVNGPDGFLTIRAGPGSQFASQRKLNRLAIVEVDTRFRQGFWVQVIDAYRTHTKGGTPQKYKSLQVIGWAHDGYLCAFLD
ncbi:MAG: hypothetical protein GY947_19740 [Rhodobacteraceae bacterium]|nr:hypothetical protein [Paracoccaceae bacterium]